MHTFTVSATNTSAAWVAACRALDVKANPRREGFHTVVRIADATAEDPALRAELERVRAAAGYQPIETVANTVFPARLAALCPDPAQLAERYQQIYSRLTKMDTGNRRGTYFGRIVAYPGQDGPVDQLEYLVKQLRQQAAGKGPMSAAYEVGLAHPGDGDPEPQEEASFAVPVHLAGKDHSVRGFPCLSHCSFQMDRDRTLHAVALYRSHYMLDRAYGNYLGLGRLLAYLAAAAGLRPGTLTVMAGHAQIEDHITKVRPLLQDTPSLLTA